MTAATPPVGVSLSADIEHRPDRRAPFRARVRWVDPATQRRQSKSEAFETEEAAVSWIEGLRRAALGGVDPTAATMKLADYGTAHMTLALRGLEAKTLDPYLSGWR
ncbi:MAG: site-specific integrase, partial [Pseudonocardiales bacterium]|nr:site-specific integrase [Pseudonocardiales bacterium]